MCIARDVSLGLNDLLLISGKNRFSARKNYLRQRFYEIAELLVIALEKEQLYQQHQQAFFRLLRLEGDRKEKCSQQHSFKKQLQQTWHSLQQSVQKIQLDQIPFTCNRMQSLSKGTSEDSEDYMHMFCDELNAVLSG